MSEPTFGEMVQAHVNLALDDKKKDIEEAAELAKKAGVGVWVNVHFDEQGGIHIHAEPSVRVPLGHVWVPDFNKFKLPGGD